MHSSFPGTFVPNLKKNIQSQPKNFEAQLNIGKNNVVALTMDVLEFEDNLISGAPISCKLCNAILSHTSKQYIKKKVNESIWKCEFCQYENHIIIDDAEIPANSYITYILKKPAEIKPIIVEDEKAMQAPIEKEINIIFCVDISGSMSTNTKISNSKKLKYIKENNSPTRLECVKIAIDSQIQQLIKTNPNSNVGFVFFEDSIHVYGDCTTKPKQYGGKFLNNYQEILIEADNIAPKCMNIGIKNSCTEMLQSLKELKTLGCTALGPGVLFSLGLAKNGKRGSKVIICTDGLANQGLGSVESDVPQMIEESKEFYNKIGLLAKEYGIVISVISIVDSECRLDMLSPIADLTGGNIIRVDPSKLSNDFTNCLNDSLVATNVKFEARIHKCFEFSNVLVGQLSHNNSCLSREIGNATRETIITFEYRIKPMDILAKMNIPDLKEIESCPIQTSIFYENLKGWKCMKILSKNYEIIRNEEELENKQNSIVIGAHSMQMASAFSKKGDYCSATYYIEQSINTYKNDEIIVNKLSPFNSALKIQSSPIVKNDLIKQNDMLTSEMNQAFKSPIHHN